MKKITFLVSLLFVVQVGFGQNYAPLTDSIFNYLQGTWYQSYKVVNSGASIACANGVKKHPGLPSVKITYQKTSATKGVIIKEKGARFLSTYLNWGFETNGVEKDTIHLEYDLANDRWVSVPVESFIPFIAIESAKNHLMWFYEMELAGFERDPYWSLATLLISNNWAGGHCTLVNGDMLCTLQMQYAAFTMKNDTLLYWNNSRDVSTKFVYNYDAHAFEAVGNAATKISLSKDSSIIITDEVSFKNSYSRYKFSTGPKDIDYNGIWHNMTHPSETLSLLNAADTLLGCFSAPEVHCYGGFSAVVKPGIAGSFLQVIESRGCVADLSRFVLTNNKSELLNMTTGERYSRVTSVVETTLTHELALKTNPVVGGASLEVLGLDEFEYQIFTSSGRLLGAGEGKKGTVDLEGLGQGYYILNAHTNQGFFVAKFVVE